MTERRRRPTPLRARLTGPGRHTRYTPGLVQALCDVLRVGGTRTAACAHVALDSSLFYDWLHKHPAFSREVARAEADAELRFSSVVMHAAVTDNDWRAAAFWLERRRPDEWAEKQKLDVTVGLDVPKLMREHLLAQVPLEQLPAPEPEPIIIDQPGPEPEPPNGRNGTAH